MKLPMECPACRAEQVIHQLATTDMHEWSRYLCGAELVLVNDELEVNDYCKGALENAVMRINAGAVA